MTNLLKFALWIWERNIWLSSMYFRYFFPWKRARPFIWTNLNPLKSHKNALSHVWLKLALWLCRRFSNRCTFAISLLAPLGIRQGSSFKERESPSHSNLPQWFWRRKRKCEKFTTTTTPDNKQILLTWAFGSCDLKISNSFCILPFQLFLSAINTWLIATAPKRPWM